MKCDIFSCVSCVLFLQEQEKLPHIPPHTHHRVSMEPVRTKRAHAPSFHADIEELIRKLSFGDSARLRRHLCASAAEQRIRSQGEFDGKHNGEHDGECDHSYTSILWGSKRYCRR